MGYFSEVKPTGGVSLEETKSRVESRQLNNIMTDFLDIVKDEFTVFVTDRKSLNSGNCQISESKAFGKFTPRIPYMPYKDLHDPVSQLFLEIINICKTSVYNKVAFNNPDDVICISTTTSKYQDDVSSADKLMFVIDGNVFMKRKTGFGGICSAGYEFGYEDRETKSSVGPDGITVIAVIHPFPKNINSRQRKILKSSLISAITEVTKIKPDMALPYLQGGSSMIDAKTARLYKNLYEAFKTVLYNIWTGDNKISIDDLIQDGICIYQNKLITEIDEDLDILSDCFSYQPIYDTACGISIPIKIRPIYRIEDPGYRDIIEEIQKVFPAITRVRSCPMEIP